MFASALQGADCKTGLTGRCPSFSNEIRESTISGQAADKVSVSEVQDTISYDLRGDELVEVGYYVLNFIFIYG